MNTKNYGIKELENEFGPLTFGNALGSFRLGKGMSQKEFARFLGITPQSLCDLEKSRRIPSPGRAAKIAKKLKEPIAFWVQLSFQDTTKKE
ncbi:MAG: helix-turn-helix transcriptional regulator, partial [Planctomycetes bacterium]|nr:helix-turn-helix transcriptional regulator [Planctomycetota bacterium]